MVLAESEVNCSSEEVAFDKVSGAWTNFIKNTTRLSSDSPFYTQERTNMVKEIRSVIPPDCYDEWVILPDKTDPFDRPKLDQIIDDVLYDMSKEYSQHPEVVDLINSKPYWNDFVESKQNIGS